MVKLACGDTVPEDSLRNSKLMFGKFAGLTLLEIAEGTKGSRWLEDEDGVLRGHKLPDGFEAPYTWISEYDGVNFLDWLAGQPTTNEEEVVEIKSGRLKGTTYKRKGWVYRDTHDAVVAFLAHPSMQRKLQESLSPRCFDGKESIPVLLRGGFPALDNELAPYASSEQTGDSRIDNSKWRNHGIAVWLEVKPAWGTEYRDPDPTPSDWSTRGYAVEDGVELQEDDGWQESVKEEPDFDWRPAKPKPLTERRCWEEGIGWLVRLESLASMSDGTVTTEEMIERQYAEGAPLALLIDAGQEPSLIPTHEVSEPWVVDMLTELHLIAGEIRSRFCITLTGGKRVLREQVPERLIEELRKAYGEAERRVWGLLAERYPDAAKEHETSLEEVLEIVEILKTAHRADMRRQRIRKRKQIRRKLRLVELETAEEYEETAV